MNVYGIAAADVCVGQLHIVNLLHALRILVDGAHVGLARGVVVARGRDDGELRMAAFGLVVEYADVVVALLCAVDAHVLRVLLADEVDVGAHLGLPAEAVVGGARFERHAPGVAAAGCQVFAAALLAQQHIAALAAIFGHEDVTVRVGIRAVSRQGRAVARRVGAKQFLIDIEPDEVFLACRNGSSLKTLTDAEHKEQGEEGESFHTCAFTFSFVSSFVLLRCKVNAFFRNRTITTP